MVRDFLLYKLEISKPKFVVDWISIIIDSLKYGDNIDFGFFDLRSKQAENCAYLGSLYTKFWMARSQIL